MTLGGKKKHSNNHKKNIYVQRDTHQATIRSGPMYRKQKQITSIKLYKCPSAVS